MNWDELCGSTVSVFVGDGPRSAQMRWSFSGIGDRIQNPGFQLSSPAGTIIVLNFAQVAQLAGVVCPKLFGLAKLTVNSNNSKQSVRGMGR